MIADPSLPFQGQVIALTRGKRLLGGGTSFCLYRLEHGCVRLETGRSDGRREIVGYLFPGDTLSAWPEETNFSAEVVADGHAVRFSLPLLVEMMRSEPAAALSLFRAAERTLSELTEQVGHLMRQSAADRLKWFLNRATSRHAGANGSRLDLPMSRQEIADFLGIAPETVSRLFRQLQSNGQLRKTGRRQYLYNPPVRLGRDARPGAVATA